ncbi:MAG: hypothetical protein IPK82_14150 [Polyangiaceae bacterium]|nr:hypothetical protein [Polyangiaceae bacterium]
MRSGKVLAPSIFLGLLLSAAGCLERPLQSQDPRSTAMIIEPLKLSAVERIDLLFAVDNSASMGDKQEILARAIPDLVKRLANPKCLDGAGNPAESQPQSPTDPCPVGTEREFLAVPDIHIGIVSSALGGPDGLTCGADKYNDKGHLLSRRLNGSTVPTYESMGFLAWDPDQKLSPPGESILDAGDTGLVPSLQEMVVGVGENGCGYEAQLESWYRFLIDPDPYKKLVLDGDDLVPEGVDDVIIDQRKAFLRPDSLVAIIMLSDENDCSIAPGKGAAKLFRGDRMVKPRSECSENGPNDPCCAPCDDAPPACAEDPSCTTDDGALARLAKEEDHVDLRCFNQKERFGKNYLYPTSRYTKGLTELHVPDRYGKLVPNPLFMDLNLNDDLTGERNSSLVFLAGIVGVPWQDIARDPTTLTKGLKSAKELAERDSKGITTWDIILGDPESGTLPLDPHMIESTKPREGTNPVTGTDMAPPTAGYGADPISGHEQPFQIDNPQYACTFPLLTPLPCESTNCQCKNPEGDPLCQDESGAYTTTQVAAKAYPGLRELSVLKGLNEQAIVGSVCPSNMDESAETDALDFGYRPAIGALIDQLRGKLGHQCLPRKLTPAENGQVKCLVLEARKSETCSCKPEDGRVAVSDEHVDAVQSALESGLIREGASCFCEVPQLEGAELTACQNENADPLVVDGEQVNGFCYIDATAVPPVGSPELVPDSCVSTERRVVRLVGNAKARPGSDYYVMCSEG